jgi:hypothetical protein
MSAPFVGAENRVGANGLGVEKNEVGVMFHIKVNSLPLIILAPQPF